MEPSNIDMFFNINGFIYHFHTLLNAMKSQSKLPPSRCHPFHPRSPVQASCFRLRAPSGAAEQKNPWLMSGNQTWQWEILS